MSSNVLLLGRTGIVLDNVEAALDVTDVALFAGTSLDDVKSTMATQPIDHVIMGAGMASKTASQSSSTSSRPLPPRRCI